MNENPGPTEMPVTLLAQALLDLKEARGNSATTRQAVIHYFKAGITSGMQVGPLLNWLFFWPSQSESVFGQAGYSQKESLEFIEMVKRMTLRELGLSDQGAPFNEKRQP